MFLLYLSYLPKFQEYQIEYTNLIYIKPKNMPLAWPFI